MKHVLKTVTVVAMIGLLFTAILYPAVAEEYRGIYQNTIRLHVLADSNDPKAQALKLKVRDALIADLTPIVENCIDRTEAEKLVAERLALLEDIAEETLNEEECMLPVSVMLGEEYYPTRAYEDCSYPAGEYLSLRVFIGSGEGKNWWCVIYPPLCLSASSASEFEGYTEEEQEILKGEKTEYRVKFAFLEWGAKLKQLFA